MEIVLMYLLKMLVSSAVLFGYYRLALYNECFHQWNRFYLLTAMLLSVIVPFISIPIIVTSESSDITTVIAAMPWNEASVVKAETISWKEWIFIAASLVSFIFFSKFLWSIWTIAACKSRNVSSLYNNVQLIITNLTNAPFSFFNWLFWREDIDPASTNGQRMLNHELAHIRGHHSIDKVFTSLLLCFFWMNPFFWLMRRELNIIHEFLADREAIGPKDGAAFAEMILQALPLKKTIYYGLVNPFFSSQIKRRLFMITTSKHPKYNYLSRISGLALMIFAVFFLAISIQKVEAQKTAGNITIKEVRTGKGDSTFNLIKVTSTPEKDVISVVADRIILNDNKDLISMEGNATIKVWNNGKDSGFQGSANSLVISSQDTTLKTSKKAPLYIVNRKELTGGEVKEIAPNSIKEVNVFKSESALSKYGERGKDGVVEIILNSSKEPGGVTQKVLIKNRDASKASPLYYVDGKAVGAEEMNKINPSDIQSINVIKEENATKKYGEKAKDGVVEITMKIPVT